MATRSRQHLAFDSFDEFDSIRVRGGEKEVRRRTVRSLAGRMAAPRQEHTPRQEAQLPLAQPDAQPQPLPPAEPQLSAEQLVR